MKVKRRKNGEIVEVEAHGDMFVDNQGRSFYYDEIDIIEEPDWQHYRIQAAIAAMQGMLSSKETMVSITAKAKERNISVPKALAMLSVSDADALVEELKKGVEE